MEFSLLLRSGSRFHKYRHCNSRNIYVDYSRLAFGCLSDLSSVRTVTDPSAIPKMFQSFVVALLPPSSSFLPSLSNGRIRRAGVPQISRFSAEREDCCVGEEGKVNSSPQIACSPVAHRFHRSSRCRYVFLARKRFKFL